MLGAAHGRAGMEPSWRAQGPQCTDRNATGHPSLSSLSHQLIAAPAEEGLDAIFLILSRAGVSMSLDRAPSTGW